MRTPDIELAIAKHINYRTHLIVPNIWWGLGFNHELDLIVVTGSRYAWEIEIKVSKADLLNDKLKKHGHRSNKIRRLYFAVPKKLEETALSEIPERAGLFVVDDKYYRSRSWVHQVKPAGYKTHVSLVRSAKLNTNARKLTESEMSDLYRLAVLRIWGLKAKISKLQNK